MAGLKSMWGLALMLAVAQACSLLDLVVVIDSSSQVGAAGFKAEIELCISLAIKIGISRTGVNFAGIVYGDAQETEVFLPMTDDTTTAVLALNNLTFFDNQSAPGTGLYFAVGETSGRPGAAKIVLLLSGSTGNDGLNEIQEATQVKRAGAQLFAFGAGECDVSTLQQIVSGSQDYFYANSFPQALSYLPTLISAICSLSPTSSSSSTSSSSTTGSPYTNTGPGSVTCGSNTCSPGSQCCGDSSHPATTFYCCNGNAGCCYGTCCAENQYCNLHTRSCYSGGSQTSADPYTTTSGSTTCGGNLCSVGSQCCSDDGHPDQTFYCCQGTATCCHGACCQGDWICSDSERLCLPNNQTRYYL
eukprot:Phypoly_transcript_09230.p1 GENE.Phypoly_transcript_09230~~Phypoly_transcript_09230.p1  ORF type:complete len:422 (+),score=39.97 Phypoly_transcript_09230:191-1267(+)